MACNHPDPALCEQLKMHIHGRLWEIWNGVNIAPDRAEVYRSKWRAAAAEVRPAPEKKQPVYSINGRVVEPPQYLRNRRQKTAPCNCKGNDVRENLPDQPEAAAGQAVSLPANAK